jgi:predicted dehydrogenase
MEALASICGDCPVFETVKDLLASDVAATMNGAIICTPHPTHFQIAESLIQEGMNRLMNDGASAKILHILLEKPMTTDVEEAKKLHELAHSYWRTCTVTCGDSVYPYFQINHSANFREQTRVACDLIQKEKAIGSIRHINASMASPLSWLFGHPRNWSWNQPSEGMLGNGFAWGQSSHLLAWVFHVAGDELIPQQVFCVMNHSETSGADLSHSATIKCRENITFSLAGTCLLPGNEHGDPPVGKEILVEIYGTDGALFYRGNDHDPSSGRLELRVGAKDKSSVEGSAKVYCEDLGFHFENTEQGGKGPESLQAFIAACSGQSGYYEGASSLVGWKSIQTLDAMYRSQHSGTVENIMD